MAGIAVRHFSVPANVANQYVREAKAATLPVEGYFIIRLTQDALKDGSLDRRTYDSASLALEKLADLLEITENLTGEQLIKISVLLRGLSQYATTEIVPLPKVENLDLADEPRPPAALPQKGRSVLTTSKFWSGKSRRSA